jgi:hypothetical protein
MNYLFSSRNQANLAFDVTGYDRSSFEQSIYTAQFGHQHVLFEAPNIGSSSRILLPSNVFQNTIVVRDYNGWYQHPDYNQYADEYDGVVSSWRFSYFRDDSVRYAWQNHWLIDISPSLSSSRSFVRSEFSSTKRLRVVPNWILTLNGSIGYASQEIPTPEKYRLIQFKSFIGDRYRRTNATLKVDLDFPLRRELEANVLNVVSLKTLRGNIFGTAAAIGSRLYDEPAIQAAESGVALKMIFTTFGGLVDLNLDLGYVMPWYKKNIDKSLRAGPFIGLGLYSVL